MAELINRLIRDHRHLLRVLDLLDGLLDQFRAGGELNYELLCELLEYMEDYADQIHHPSEEDVFNRLRARGYDKYPVLDLLSNQHLQLSQVNKRFRRSLEGIMHEGVLRRDQVEVQGRELVKTLREHVDLEEREAFPLAREQLFAGDWDELLSAASSEQDPLFGEAGQKRFQSLLRYLAEWSC